MSLTRSAPDGGETIDVTGHDRRRPLALEKRMALGTPAAERLERIVRLARRICDVPVACVELSVAADSSANTGERRSA